jgi:hypothetical protein
MTTEVTVYAENPNRPVVYTSEENKSKKWFKNPELGVTLFSMTALRMGLLCNFFLITLLALLIFLFLG